MDTPIGLSLQTTDEIVVLRQRIAELERALAQQRLADAATRERQVHFQTLYEDTPAMAFVLSPEGVILSVNRYGAEQLGYRPEELIGQSVLMIFDPIDHHTVLRQLTVCEKAHDSTLGWELQKIRKNGSRLWVRETARTIRDAAGSSSILVVCEDITTRKTAEEELRMTAQKLQALIHACPLAIMSLDNEGDTVTLWNPAAESMFGWQAHETLGQATPFLSPSQQMESDRMWDKLLAEGSLTGEEFRRARKDGTPIDLSLWATVLKNECGHVTGTLGLVADMTRRKLVEEALRESEQAIRELQEAISRPLLTFDQRAQTILELGCRRFKLPIGIMTRLHGQDLVVTHVSAPPGTAIYVGMVLPADKTLCRSVLTMDGPRSVDRTSASHDPTTFTDFASYIGTKLHGLNTVHGTICFGAPTPRSTGFTDADKDFLLLMAQWIGQELDRQTSEQALKQQESLLRAVVDTATDAIFMKDTEGRYQLINAAGARVIGKTVEQIIGETDLELFATDTATRLMEDDQRVMKEGTQHHFEALITSQGVTRTFASIKSPLRNPQGHVMGLVGVSRDISEQKRGDAALRDSEARWKTLFEHAGVGIAQLSLSGQFLRVNARLCETLGYASRTLCHLTFQEITHPEDLETNLRLMQELMTSTYPSFSMEKRFLRSDGLWLWANLTVSLVRSPAGAPACFIHVVEDISERKQAEEALQRSEARLHRFVADAPIGLVIMDAQKRLLSANKAFCKLTGYTEDEIIGKTYALYTHPDDLTENVILTDEFFQGKRSGYTFEKRYIRKQGDIIWVAVKAISIELPGHPGPLLLAVVEDITRPKQAMEERARISQDLHDDVLQSLYAVGMGLEATKERLKSLSPSTAKRLEGSVAQLNGVIHDVRSFIPRMETLSNETRNFEQALRSLVGSFQATGAGDITVTIDEAAAVALSPEYCRDVIGIAKEALSNSLRHAKARRRSVTFRQHLGKLRLEIADNGKGFSCARPCRGMGLSNMRTRAKKLGARLAIESAPRRGTRIVLDLPLR